MATGLPKVAQTFCVNRLYSSLRTCMRQPNSFLWGALLGGHQWCYPQRSEWDPGAHAEEEGMGRAAE